MDYAVGRITDMWWNSDTDVAVSARGVKVDANQSILDVTCYFTPPLNSLNFNSTIKQAIKDGMGMGALDTVYLIGGDLV